MELVSFQRSGCRCGVPNDESGPRFLTSIFQHPMLIGVWNAHCVTLMTVYDCDLLHVGSLAALWATGTGGQNLSRSELMRWHFLFLWQIVLCAVMYLDVMPTKHEARAICVCRVLATGASKGKLRPGDVWMLSTIDIHWPDVDEAEMQP